MTEMYLRQSGTKAHTSTKQITDEQITQLSKHPDIVHFGKSIVLGVAQNQCLAGRQVEIRYGSDQYAKDGFAYPTTGKMPQQKNEIALDTLTLERLGISLELGQSVTLEQENGSDTFTLCGWWEGNLSYYASMVWVSEQFASIFFVSENVMPIMRNPNTCSSDDAGAFSQASSANCSLTHSLLA